MKSPSLRKLLTNSVIYGFAPHISKIANILVLPIITKYLTEEDYGIYGLVTSYTLAISTLAFLGLNVPILNSFYHYKERYRWRWRQIYGFLIQWMSVFGCLQILILYFIFPNDLGDNRLLAAFLVSFPIIFFGPTTQIATAYYQFNYKPMPVVIRTVIFGLLTLGLNVLFISKMKMGYMGWLWSGFISGIGLNLSYWFVVNVKLKIKPIFNYNKSVIKNALKVGLPTVPHSYSPFLIGMGNRIVMDKMHMPMSEIGKYNFASTFSNIFDMLGMGLGNAFNPRLNECYRDNKERTARILVWFMQVVMFGVTFISCIWLKEIFELLVKNESLAQTYSLGIILIMGTNYRPMYIASANKFFYHQQTNRLWLITFLGGILNIVLCIILVPYFGVWVVVIVLYLSLMYMGYSGFFMKEYKNNTEVNYYHKEILLSTILLSIFAYFAVDFQWWLKSIITIIYAITIISLGLFLLKRIKNETN